MVRYYKNGKGIDYEYVNNRKEHIDERRLQEKPLIQGPEEI